LQLKLIATTDIQQNFVPCISDVYLLTTNYIFFGIIVLINENCCLLFSPVDEWPNVKLRRYKLIFASN